jgi:protein SCO1/2
MAAGHGKAVVLALTSGLTLLAAGSGQLARGASALADIGPAPGVALTDQAGKPFDLARLQGKAVLVSFVYTTCGGTCPATTHTLYRVQQALREAGLWGKRVEFVSITLDPARDHPDVLAGYARVFDADTSAWHFLTGRPETVAQVIAAWGMWVKPGPAGALDHPSRIFLLDPRGHQREIYSLEFLRPAVVVSDVETVLAEPPLIADPEKQPARTGSGPIRR